MRSSQSSVPAYGDFLQQLQHQEQHQHQQQQPVAQAMWSNQMVMQQTPLQQQQQQQPMMGGAYQNQLPPQYGAQRSPGRLTPPSGSGDESSGSDRRDGRSKDAMAKKTRPKRRSDPHDMGGSDAGRPPLYNGPTHEFSSPTSEQRSRLNRKMTPPPQLQSHTWSSSSDDGNGREQDEHRLRQRSKQLNFGKVTQGYKNYRHSVPKSERQPSNGRHPLTPDASQKCSKRRWDAMVAAWRRALHLWDTDPNPVHMLAQGCPTLAELGEEEQLPHAEYIRQTDLELQRVALEVASMHSGGASNSSQTAGETSMDDLSTNTPDHNVSMQSIGTVPNDQTQNKSPGVVSLQNEGAKTLISIVHVPPKSAWSTPTGDSSTLTLTLTDHNPEALFTELRRHFDTSVLTYDPTVADVPAAYRPDMFSASASANNGHHVALSTVKRVEQYLELAPMLPRLEYHGRVMPVLSPNSQPAVQMPTSEATRRFFKTASLDELQATGAHLSASELLDSARDVQLTPTRSLLEEYASSLKDLTFNVAEAFDANTGSTQAVVGSQFYGTAPAPTSQETRSYAALLRESLNGSPVTGTGSGALASDLLEVVSPVRRSP